MDAIHSSPTDSDIDALLASSSADTTSSLAWPPPYTSSSGELVFNDSCWQQTGFSMDDMMIDVFNPEFNTNDMDWTLSLSEPDTSTTNNYRRWCKKDKTPSNFVGMQSKFSAGRKSYVAPPSAAVWESQKTELHRLYIHEDKTLKDIMSIMELKDFKASTKMYKTRFKQWGFVKNNTRDSVSKMIKVRRQRAATGKPTTFERNGRVVKIDQYLRKNGMIFWDLNMPNSPNELPSSVRCHTPPPECLSTPGPLLLKELLMRCLKDLSPSFSSLQRPADGRFSNTTELWDSPRYIKLACDLFSDNRNTQAGSICNSAFRSVHALVHPPRLDTLFNFLVSQLWWANRDITLELWRYLAAYMSNVLSIQNGIYQFIRGLVEHIETYGYEAYLDFMTECFDDILISSDDGRTPLWRTDNQLVGWCQLIVMDCYFINGQNSRASRIQDRCAEALPMSRLFPNDRKMNEQIWRETFGRSLWTPRSKSARHEKFLSLAFSSYAKILGRLRGKPVMHPSLTRIEGVVRGLSKSHLDLSAIKKHNRSFSVESRILSFLTRDISKGGSMPVDYGSYPV